MWEYVVLGRGLEVKLRACFGGVVSDAISGVYMCYINIEHVVVNGVQYPVCVIIWVVIGVVIGVVKRVVMGVVM